MNPQLNTCPITIKEMTTSVAITSPGVHQILLVMHFPMLLQEAFQCDLRLIEYISPFPRHPWLQRHLRKLIHGRRFACCAPGRDVLQMVPG